MFLKNLLALIKNLDHQFFYSINSVWVGPWFDLYFPNVTDLHRNNYALLIIGLFIALWVHRQRSRAIKGILVLVLAIGAADLFSYRVIKHTIQRDRPAAAGLSVELRSKHHSGSSFPSNHAANIFAAATIVTALHPPLFLLAFFVAFSVAYSRVYVGVHFPSDVIAGALIGFIIARIIWSYTRQWINHVDYEEDHTRFRRTGK